MGSVLESMQWWLDKDRNGRDKTMKEVIGIGSGGEKIRIKIVSVCEYNGQVTPLGELSKRNKQAYASKHGYELEFYETGPIFHDYFTSAVPPNRPPAWSKIDAVLNSFGSDADWIMWMDCDSFFMDTEVELERVVAKVGGTREDGIDIVVERMRNWTPLDNVGVQDAIDEYNSVLNEYISVNSTRATTIITSEDGLMLNTGIFFVRNSVFGFQLLQKTRQMTFANNPATWHTWWEQTALVLLMYVLDQAI